AVAAVLVPGLAVAASSPLGEREAQTKTVVQELGGNILTPVDDSVRLEVRQAGSSRRLDWTSGGSWRADVFYRGYRHDGPGDDTLRAPSGGGAWECFRS